MADGPDRHNSAEINRWLLELRAGNPSARQQLIATAQARLVKLVRRMMSDFSRVRQWEETDDVFQNAAIRLCRSLDHTIPESTTALMRLAARDIRCALIDLARHYGGPLAIGSHQHPPGMNSSMLQRVERSDETHEPQRLARWSEFHEQVQALPDELQEVMDLVWYQGLSQTEAADWLQISERTVQRRWRQACLALHDALHGLPPGIG